MVNLPIPFGPILPVQEGVGTDEGPTDENESYVGFDFWGESQENPLLVGPARTFYDYTFEYDQTLNGREDTRDLPFRNIATTLEGADDYAQGQHDSQNWITAAVGIVGIMVVLYLIRPLLEIGAAIAEE